MPTLDINGVSMNKDRAWQVRLSMARLLASPPTRNNNQLLPYADGQVAMDQWYDQAVIDMAVDVYGFKDSAGAAHSNRFDGMVANALYLRTNVFSVKGLVPAVLHLSSGDLTADVQVRNDQVSDIGGALVITFDLIIPEGQFS